MVEAGAVQWFEYDHDLSQMDETLKQQDVLSFYQLSEGEQQYELDRAKAALQAAINIKGSK